MGNITRIDEASGSLEISADGKSFKMKGDETGRQNFSVYGIDGTGNERWRSDLSLVVSGGGGGSDYVKASAYPDFHSLVADAAALNKPALIDQDTLLDLPSNRLFTVAGNPVDASVTVNIDAAKATIAGFSHNINTAAAPTDPNTGRTTYKGNTLADYSHRAATLSQPVVDQGGGVVRIRITSIDQVNKFVPGQRVWIEGSTNYNDTAGYIVHAYVNLTTLDIIAPFVAETFSFATTRVVRGLIGIPSNGVDIRSGVPVTVKGTGTYLDGKIYTTDPATDTWNHNEIVVEERYVATTFTQGKVEHARIALPVTGHGYLSSTKLTVTVAGTPGGVYDGTWPMNYTFSDANTVAIDGPIFDDTNPDMTGTVKFNLTSISNTTINPGFRVSLRGYLGADEHYNGYYFSQPGTNPTLLINKEFVAATVDGSQQWSVDSIANEMDGGATIHFLNNGAKLQVQKHVLIRWPNDLKFDTPDWQIFELIDEDLRLDQQSAISFADLDKPLKLINWGIQTGLNVTYTVAKANTKAVCGCFNSASYSKRPVHLHTGIVEFFGLMVGSAIPQNEDGHGENFIGFTTSDVFGDGQRNSVLQAHDSSRGHVYWHKKQGTFNTDIRNLGFIGHDTSNNGSSTMHPETPMVIMWGFNNSMRNCWIGDSGGVGLLLHPRQSQDHRITNTEVENSVSANVHVHGVGSRITIRDCSFEVGKYGVLVTPNIAGDNSWASPGSVPVLIAECYMEKQDEFAVALLGVRNVKVQGMRNVSSQESFLLGQWDDQPAVTNSLDYTHATAYRGEIGTECRGNVLLLSPSSSVSTVITDYSDATQYQRNGNSKNTIMLDTRISGNSLMNSTNPQDFVGTGNVFNPWGDGIEKNRGSLQFTEDIAYVDSIGYGSRMQASPASLSINFDMPVGGANPGAEAFYRFHWFIHPLWVVSIRIVDLTPAPDLEYNFRNEQFESTPLPTNENRFFFGSHGKWETTFLRINFGGVLRRLRIVMSITFTSTVPNADTPMVLEYIDIVDDNTRGFVHMRDGIISHVGKDDLKQTISLSAAGTVRNYQRKIMLDSGAAAFSVNLPENPSPGQVHIFQQDNTSANNNIVTLDGGSRNINKVGTVPVPVADFSKVTVRTNEDASEWFME